MYTELHSLSALRTHLNAHGSLVHTVCQGLDLRDATALLTTYPAEDAYFLGCALEGTALQHIHDTGGTVFPYLGGLPYEPYRPRLYSIGDLMQGYRRGVPGSFARDTKDSAIYAHYQRHRTSDRPVPIIECLAQRLHDHAIDDALTDLLQAHDRVVGIMGGHALQRGEPAYRAIALIARALTQRGFFVATGGGPGAMEAGNLGAWFANHSADALRSAIDHLAQEGDYRTGPYLDLAYDVRDRYPGGAASLAIPTWFYGHEPTNLFAAHIAKYFANSLREDGLLAIATHGVIYAPGSAGTIQEIFMDAAQNHYGTFDLVSPMVFYDRTYWTQQKPVYPLLEALAAHRQYGDLLTVTDDPAAVVTYLEDHPPVPYAA